jgi:hypothetical protein
MELAFVAGATRVRKSAVTISPETRSAANGRLVAGVFIAI